MVDQALKLELTLTPGTVFLGNGGVEKWLSPIGGRILTQDTVASKPQLQLDGLYFDGGDSLLGSIATLATNFAVEFWYNSPTVGAANSPFVSIGIGSDLSIMLGWQANTYFVSSDGNNWNIATGRTMGTVSANTWHHIAFVKNGTNYALFNNGILADSFTSASTPFPTTNLQLGKYATYYGSGKLTGIRIWNYAKYIANFTPPMRSQFGLSMPPVPPITHIPTAVLNQFDSGD